MKLVKRYSKVSNLVIFFELEYVHHFCLKSFSFFSTKGLRGRGQLHAQVAEPGGGLAPLLFFKGGPNLRV